MDNLYINVFCDRQGALHYSSEEFSLYQDKLAGFKAAAQDACRLSVLGGWRYICTLSNNDTVTMRMRALLKECDAARYALEQAGKNPENFTMEAMLEAAETLTNA